MSGCANNDGLVEKAKVKKLMAKFSKHKTSNVTSKANGDGIGEEQGAAKKGLLRFKKFVSGSGKFMRPGSESSAEGDLPADGQNDTHSLTTPTTSKGMLKNKADARKRTASDGDDLDYKPRKMPKLNNDSTVSELKEHSFVTYSEEIDKKVYPKTPILRKSFSGVSRKKDKNDSTLDLDPDDDSDVSESKEHSFVTYPDEADKKVYPKTPISSKRSLSRRRSFTPLSKKSPKLLSSNYSIPWVKSLPRDVVVDSSAEGERVFSCIIKPMKTKKFFGKIWEKKPLVVRRHNLSYNRGLFSTAEFDRVLRKHHLNFSENIDVVTFVDDARQTHNPTGRALAPVVWDFYQQGCSVRLLNPQTYSKRIWTVLSLLQEFFGSMAGANIYLTPPGTQGFAPHWDDIEAFVLQLEGKKHWKIYEPRSQEEVLPLHSSSNFTSADVGDPVLEVTLKAGDLLYFPRGYIHQGNTGDDSHSLHITISVGQRNTWGDFLQMLLPHALEVAMEEDVEFRKSLPRDYLSYMGLSFNEQKADHPGREKFARKLETLFKRIWRHAPLDSAADQMAKKFLESSLPPSLTTAEKNLTIFGQGEHWSAKAKRVVDLAEIQPDTKIRVVRRGSVRLVSGEKISICHNLENARVFQGSEFKCIGIEDEEADAVEFLLNAYPKFVSVEQLPLPSLELQIKMASLLYDEGLIMTKQPLGCFDEDDHPESECSCCSRCSSSENEDDDVQDNGGNPDDDDADDDYDVDDDNDDEEVSLA